MRYKGVTQGCTIEKQMLVPKKHLKLTPMRKSGVLRNERLYHESLNARYQKQ